MHWGRILLIFAVPLITQQSFGQETEELETTTLQSNFFEDDADVSTSTTEKRAELNDDLRNALLKALTELENDSSERQDNPDEEKSIEKASASAVTYFEKGDESPEDQQNNQQLTSTDDSNNQENENSEDPTVIKATQIVVQKSNGIQSGPITSFEKEPTNFLKDAEHIITSASNSFTTQDDDSKTVPETRSVKNTDTNTKSYANFNTISNFDSKSSSKTVVEKFSDGKAVNEPPFVKTYVSPLGNNVSDQPTYKPVTITGVSSKSSVTSDAKNSGDSDVRSNGNDEKTEASTEATVEVSPEENEAKVEQVQFFSAPLVAAFTVHQDEKGLPKKVEPIYKNEINVKKSQESIPQNTAQQNENLQSSTFSNVDLQKKQQILELELQKLRNQQLLQQEQLFARNNANNQGFNNNNLGFTQSGFNQAVNQHFNQYDPIFTEPDRSVVTKLATIDPSKLLAQNGGPILNKFTANEAILPVSNTQKSNFANQVVPDVKPNNQNDVSLIPSITYNPLVEAGKLPLNAQILPTKEPTGFFNFKQPTNIQSSVGTTNFGSQNSGVTLGSNLAQNFAQSSFNAQNLPQNQQTFLVQPNQNFVQSTPNLIQPNIQTIPQNSNPNFLNAQGFGTGLNTAQNQISTFQAFKNANDQSLNNNNQFLTSNRILRQEQGTGNLGINTQNTFSIVPSQQPLRPTHELGYFPDNRFLRQNQESTLTQPQNLAGQKTRFPQNNIDLTRNLNGLNQQRLQGAQNQFQITNNQDQNRYLRSNLEGTVTGFNNYNIQQSIQPFGPQLLSNSPQQNRYFRSNQESSLGSVQNYRNTQNLGFNQAQSLGQTNRFLRSNLEGNYVTNQNRFSQPILQNYRYRNSFGF